MRRYIIVTAFMLVLVLALFVSFRETPGGGAPKYIFLFVGDGFGYPQLTLATLYNSSVLGGDELALNSFEYIGNAYTENTYSQITESAGAISAIASGIKTDNESLNIDFEGKKHETIAEKLKRQLGYKIGVISSDNLNRATPAGFYAHQKSRYDTMAIILELAESGFEYFGGSDIVGFISTESMAGKGLRDFLGEHGYRYINTREDIEKLGSAAADGKVVAVSPMLDPYGTIPYAIDKERHADSFTLAEHTKKCAEFLYGDGKNGFFIVVEGGKIDWACHANDAATLVHEVIDFDGAIKAALAFYHRHPKETLIIVTGDHETGGLSIGYSETGTRLYLHQLAEQTISYSEFSFLVQGYRRTGTPFEEVLPEIRRYFGIGPYDGENADFYLGYGDMEKLRAAYDMSMTDPSERPFTMSEYMAYGFYDPLTMTIIRLTNNKAGISWGTYSHSALPVPVLAMGNGAENFTGFYKNTEIFAKLKKLLDLD